MRLAGRLHDAEQCPVRVSEIGVGSHPRDLVRAVHQFAARLFDPGRGFVERSGAHGVDDGRSLGAATNIGGLLGEAIAVAQGAANETLDGPGREAAQAEFTRITQEIDTVARGADFGGFNLIDPGARNITIPTTEAGADIEIQAKNPSSAGLGIDKLSLGSAGAAGHAVVFAEGALSHITSAIARFGATATRISELGTAEMVAVLPEDRRLTGMVDADLTAETAEATAAAAKDELGRSTLSIANGNPQALAAAAS